MRHTVMNEMIKYYSGILIALVSYSAAAADAHSIQHKIESFLSSDAGSIAFILLLSLILFLFLLLLAVFVLNSKLKNLIKENRETNKILSDIRSELTALSTEETPGAHAERVGETAGESTTADLYNEIKFDS